MSEAADIARAGLVIDEAAGKVRSAAHAVGDAGRQLALNTESLQYERQRWQDEVLPELRAVSAEILAGFAELREIRQKAGESAGEPGLGIALADPGTPVAAPGGAAADVRGVVAELLAVLRLRRFGLFPECYCAKQRDLGAEHDNHCARARAVILAAEAILAAPPERASG